MNNPFEDKRSLINIKFPPVPSTTSILAFGFLAGCLLFTPMIAVIGRYIPLDFREAVLLMVNLFKDGMLLILGFYFAKVVNQGQTDMANKAIDTAREAAPVGPLAVYSSDAADGAAAVAEAAQTASDQIQEQQ